MMTTRLFVPVSLALIAWAQAAAANDVDLGDGDPESRAYCDLIAQQAGSEAALAGSPVIIGQGEARTSSGDHKQPFADDAGRKYTAGMQLGLQRFVQAGIRTDQAHEECRRFTAQRAAARGLDAARKSGVAAKLAVYKGARDSLEGNLDEAKRRLGAGTATMGEVDAIAEAIMTVRTTIVDLEQEASRLSRQQGGDAKGLAATSGAIAVEWSRAERAQRDLDQSALNAKSWELNVFGGYQTLFFGKERSSAPYASVELKLNLGNVARFGDGSDVRAAHEAWRKASLSSAAESSAAFIEEIKSLSVALDEKLHIAHQRQSELSEFITAAKAIGGELARRLELKKLVADAEARGLEAESASLKTFMGVPAAAEAPAKETSMQQEPPKPVAASKPVPAIVMQLPKAPKAPPLPKPGHVLIERTSDVSNYRFATRAPGGPAAAESATIHFTVKGPSETKRALGSGAVREQLGLMLRRENQCNLLYVMWRQSPKSEIVVQEKINPGMTTHAQCENSGYRTVKASFTTAPGVYAPGEKHALSAKISGTRLTVEADGKIVWEGPAPTTIKTGTEVGFRSDNLVVEYALATDAP